MSLFIPLTARCETCKEHLIASQLPYETIPDHVTFDVSCPNGCHVKEITVNIEKLLNEAGAYTMRGA